MERDDRSLKRIYNIPLDKIDPYPDHPFKVRDDEDMMNLVESVKVNGVLTPAIVRRKEDGRYELVAGHRRKRACELAGISTLRAEIWDMTRDEAIIYMVESNFQRSTILPSEKAYAYKMRMEALNRQGKKLEGTCGPLVHKSRDELGNATGESGRTVSRYIRLTELVPEILEMVDEGKMALRPAVELSYIPKEIQEEVSNDSEHYWFDVGQIMNIKDGEVAQYVIDNIAFAGYNKQQTSFASSTLNKLYTVIKTERTLVYYKEKSEELDKVLNIFIRVNSGGTVLSYSDLLLSIATAQWEKYDAREEITEFVDTINGLGNGFNINKDFVLKTALVLSDFSDIAFKVDNFNKAIPSNFISCFSSTNRTMYPFYKHSNTLFIFPT